MSSLLGGAQSALDPHGPEAEIVAEIAWVLFGGAALIFVAVLALTVLALRGPRPWLASPRLIVGGGIVFPLVTLTALMVYVLLAAPRPAAAGAPALAIEVVGHQWWWEVRYLRPDGERDFVTANEIRLPVGAAVEVRLRSADVLHSFWVPALAGKLDLIPGKDNRLRVAAQRAGTWRGQCAEYCGGPHGQMALFVVAEEPGDFEAWRDAQRAPAAADGDARGREIFLANCASCHAVRGTPARGTLGPDLTHFASRISLGAGILPNERGAVAGWIAGNQRIKPGNLMPEFGFLEGPELEALAAYLGSLR